MKKKLTYALAAIACLLAVYATSQYLFFRWDLTAEKRYSISDQTKKLMKGIKGDIKVKIYLDGDLNAGFLKLRKDTKEMLDEFQAYSDADFEYEFINPSAAKDEKDRDKKYAELEKKGLHLIIDNEDKDEDGQSITRIVCPWAEISYKGKTIAVNLLSDVTGKSREDKLNNSSENLEYTLTDALRQLTSKNINKIAFIEGHGELPEILTYDISQTLAKYYEVDRGQLSDDPNCLSQFKAIIIAGPTKEFSEKDKYIIDQYIMHGGKVLWMIDGVRISLDSLRTQSQTIGIPLSTNLDDQLFRYGVRIDPVLVQDVQCSLVPVNTAQTGDQPKWTPSPWYYAPLLLTSPSHPVTKNLTPVKSEFASAIEFVGNDSTMKRSVLLVTSTGTHVQMMPSLVSMNIINVQKSGQYFNTGNVPVAVAMEGHFTSDFANRMMPDGIHTTQLPMSKSFSTKMIVVSNASIICNDVDGSDGNNGIVPLGYDKYMNQQFGNKDFVLNCVNYLTDDEGWMNLRNRDLQLRMLNKPAVIGQRRFWQWANVILPLFILAIFGTSYYYYRKKKFIK
jgi:ABC-2 type transport system permease protein